MAELGRRPSTTCGYRMKRARKTHRCHDCQAQIERGRLYFQDDYYAPFGNGFRYCLACGNENKRAEADWLLAMDIKYRPEPERGAKEE